MEVDKEDVEEPGGEEEKGKLLKERTGTLMEPTKRGGGGKDTKL